MVSLDRTSAQLKSTSPGLYRLPYFVYTGCRCRRGCRFRRPLQHLPLLHWLPFFIYPRGAGVEDLFYIGPSRLAPLSIPAPSPEGEGAGVEEKRQPV